MAEDELEEAQELPQKAVKADPFHAKANHQLAWIARARGNEHALEYARRVLLAEEPGSPVAADAIRLIAKIESQDGLRKPQ